MLREAEHRDEFGEEEDDDSIMEELWNLGKVIIQKLDFYSKSNHDIKASRARWLTLMKLSATLM